MSAFTTPSGKKWSFLDPKKEDVDFHDIAHNLAYQVRYNGTYGQYSIAEHSVHVHDAALEDGAPYRLCLLALLHDAHEFVIGDMVSPASRALSELMYEVGFTFLPDDGLLAIKALKERTDAAIFAAVGLDLPSEEAHAYIKRLDNEVLMTELDAMQGEQPDTADSASELVARRPFVPGRWPPKEAARQFLDRLQRYISIPEERRCGEARTDSAKEVEKCSNEASPISV